jgi:hypothetical protein
MNNKLFVPRDRRTFDSHCPHRLPHPKNLRGNRKRSLHWLLSSKSNYGVSNFWNKWGDIDIWGMSIRWSAEAFLGKGREIYILREGETLFEVLDDRHAAKESTLRHLESGPCQIHRWIVARISSTR